MATQTIYLDNNATTFAPQSVVSAMIKWVNAGNPSADHPRSAEVQTMLEQLRALIRQTCELDATYKIVLTSGASESNCCAIKSAVAGYMRVNTAIPHIVISAIEHHSIIDCVRELVSCGMATASFVAPTSDGQITALAVRQVLRQNTCIVAVMQANNETGVINDVAPIAAAAHEAGALFHCDIVQSFGKVRTPMTGVDSASISFHKVHGIPGAGALILSTRAASDFVPLISGTQNESRRGGTENVVGLGAGLAALQYTFSNITAKHKRCADLRKYILSQLAAHMPCRTYAQYKNAPTKYLAELIIFGAGIDNTPPTLPNTLLISLVKYTLPRSCNDAIKTYLRKYGIIVSVGSACTTKQKHISHVLTAMGVDENLGGGTIRVSWTAQTPLEDIQQFIQRYLEAVKIQVEKKVVVEKGKDVITDV